MGITTCELEVKNVTDISETSYEVKTSPSKETETSPWDEVLNALYTHYHEPDVLAARVLYSAVAAHDLKGQPVWPMAVAPPSTMKTELIQALDGLPRIYSLDGVTSKTFISGQIREEGAVAQAPSSLLHRIGSSGIILCAEFSTILAIKPDDRKAILADLRRIYDGRLKKEFGTSDVVPAWQGRITLIAGVTPDIDKHYSAIQSLGDRFVMVRWHRVGLEAAMRAMMQDLEKAKAELRTAVHGLFASLTATDPAVPEPFMARLAALAEYAVRGRSHVTRTTDGDKAIIGDPEAESAPRLAQQLCQLAKGSARLSGRETANSEDFEVAKRAAFDCIPARRRAMLDSAIEGGKITTTNSSTKKYDRQDLEAMGLVEGDHLSDLALKLLERINKS